MPNALPLRLHNTNSTNSTHGGRTLRQAVGLITDLKPFFPDFAHFFCPLARLAALYFGQKRLLGVSGFPGGGRHGLLDEIKQRAAISTGYREGTR